jgi:hypothetical protein
MLLNILIYHQDHIMASHYSVTDNQILVFNCSLSDYYHSINTKLCVNSRKLN